MQREPSGSGASSGIKSLPLHDGYLTLKEKIERIFDRSVNGILLQKSDRTWELFLLELSKRPLVCLEAVLGPVADEKKFLWVEYVGELLRECSTKKEVVPIAGVGLFRQKVLERFLSIFVSTFPGSSGFQVGSIVVRIKGMATILLKPDGHKRVDMSLMIDSVERFPRQRVKADLPDEARGRRKVAKQDCVDKN